MIKIKIVNVLTEEVLEIKNNLNFLVYGQGGLLDILFNKSFVYTTEFTFKNGDVARVYCLNWSQNVENSHGWTDHLSLNIQTAKFFDWLNYEAYD